MGTGGSIRGHKNNPGLGDPEQLSRAAKDKGERERVYEILGLICFGLSAKCWCRVQLRGSKAIPVGMAQG